MWNKHFSDSHKCPKLKAYLILEKCFEFVFPGCEYYDPNVTQQLRQRDCGPNSLTVIEDVFRLSQTNTPLIEIVNDKLIIKSEYLTINCNSLRLYDFKNDSYYYSLLSIIH